MSIRIEHVNVTVSDSDRSAALMQALFGWRVRWQGLSQSGGRTVHVGTDEYYLALHTPLDGGPTWPKGQPLNHIAVEVADLDAVEARALAAALRPFSHGSYGGTNRHFYLLDPDGIEFEILSYTG